MSRDEVIEECAVVVENMDIFEVLAKSSEASEIEIAEGVKVFMNWVLTSGIAAELRGLKEQVQ